MIGILNFTFYDEDSEYFHHEVKLVDINTKEVFYDKLTFMYLEMPKFNKTENELEDMFDKWMFVLRNLSRLMGRPAALQERVFTKLFEAAEIAKFSKQQYDEYEESLKAYRDWQNTIETAKMKSREEGRAEGIEVGRAEGIEGRAEGIEVGRAEGIELGRAEGRKLERIEMARKFKASGIPADIIARNTGLSEKEISDL